MDSIYLFSPWNEYKNIIPQNFQQTDALYQFIPWRMYAYEQIRKGNFPFWNPYEFGGIPFFANDQSGVLSLFNIIGYFFPFYKGFLIIAILKLIISAIGMYLFLNLFALDTASCAIGSIAYTFSALMITWLFHPLSGVTSLIPWLFWSFEQVYQSTVRRIRSKIAIFSFVTSFIIMVSFLSGHSETTVNVLLGITIYILTKLAVEHRETISVILIFTVIMIVGLLLSAIQILPFLQMLFNSVPFYNRSMVNIYEKIYLPLYAIFLWVVPNIIGNSSFSYFWMKIPTALQEAIPYIGIAPLLLGLFTLIKIKTNYKQLLPFWIMVLSGFGMAYDLPIIKWLTTLPVLRAGGAFRYIILMEFGLSALSAFGLNILINMPKHSNRQPDIYKKTVLLLLITCSISILLYWITRHSITSVSSLFRNIPFSGFLSRFTPDTIAFAVIQVVMSILFIFSTLWLIVKIYKKQMHGWIVPIGFIALTVCDLFIFGIGYNPNVSEKDFFPDTPLINKLKKLDTKKYTFYAPDIIIPPDVAMAYHLRDFRGYDMIPTFKYQNFLNIMFPDEYTNLGGSGTLFWPGYPSFTISSIAGIKYFIFPKAFKPSPQYGFLKWIGSYKDLSLWENTIALPLYYLATGIQPAENDYTALTLLSQITPENIRKAIVQGVNEPHNYKPDMIIIKEITEKPGEHVFSIQARAEGFLVLNEPYYTGWHAYINKKPVMIYPVNYLFQGIKLPAGNYEVQFIYKPKIFYTGIYISIVTLMVFLVLLLTTIRYRKIA
ncbi:MAG: YfhO family protein [bacterium]